MSSSRHLMKPNRQFLPRGFSLVEIILALVLFAGVSTAIWRLSGTSQRFNTEATSMAQQNVYSTLRAEIALQGLNPTTVTNFAAPALTDTGGTAVQSSDPSTDQRNMGFVRGLVASFETSAIRPAAGANRTQPGSALRTAIDYQTPSLSLQTAKGIGLGYSIGSTGVALPPASATPLAAPTFIYSGDLTSAPFPLNGIVNYPANPPGTVYLYTTDGSTPNSSSPVWNNNPGWTVATFPSTVTIAAFNQDPQYAPSPTASTTYTYTYTVSASLSRADGRGDLTDFTYADLQNPAGAGIVLTPSRPGATILYTTDGSMPSQANGTVYTGAFAPDAALFNPTDTLRVFAVYTPGSPDPRYIYVSNAVATYTLNPVAVAPPDPVILTDNGSPLSPGAIVAMQADTSLSNPDAQIQAPSFQDFGDVLEVSLN
jgi:prepilin-type N-terminal cleavage/methylation domain-containing protein